MDKILNELQHKRINSILMHNKCLRINREDLAHNYQRAIEGIDEEIEKRKEFLKTEKSEQVTKLDGDS